MKICEAVQESNHQRTADVSASLHTKKNEAAEQTAASRHEVTLEFTNWHEQGARALGADLSGRYRGGFSLAR